MNLKTVMALAVAAALAAPVLAQQAPRSVEKDTTPATAGATAGGFTTMDRNNDGYISRDEAKDATWNSRFSELDKDNDGRVSQSEFGALGEPASGAAGGTQSGSSTSGIGDKPGQKQ